MTSWEIDGAAALHTHAPDAAAAYDAAVEVRPLRVHDEVLLDPAVRAFADQLRADPAGVGAAQRDALAAVTEAQLGQVTQMIWIGDVTSRLRTVLDQLFTAAEWDSPRRFPVADLGVVIAGLRRAAPGLGVPAEAAGTHRSLADAVRTAPAGLAPDLVDSVRRDLNPAQAVSVVLDAALAAADGITVALGSTHPEVTEGVWASPDSGDGTHGTGATGSAAEAEGSGSALRR